MKVLGCLGAGSFGKVFKVEFDGALYAVKKVTPTLARFLLISMPKTTAMR